MLLNLVLCFVDKMEMIPFYPRLAVQEVTLSFLSYKPIHCYLAVITNILILYIGPTEVCATSGATLGRPLF